MYRLCFEDQSIERDGDALLLPTLLKVYLSCHLSGCGHMALLNASCRTVPEDVLTKRIEFPFKIQKEKSGAVDRQFLGLHSRFVSLSFTAEGHLEQHVGASNQAQEVKKPPQL